MGFDLKVFVGRGKKSQFSDVINEVNYQYYLNLKKDTIISRYTAEEYARQCKYDLLLTIPEDLESWRLSRRFKDDEINIAYTAISKARGEFSRKPRKRIKRWANGAIMTRVKQ